MKETLRLKFEELKNAVIIVAQDHPYVTVAMVSVGFVLGAWVF